MRAQESGYLEDDPEDEEVDEAPGQGEGHPGGEVQGMLVLRLGVNNQKVNIRGCWCWS